MVDMNNLFNFATSELSNDAILCWVLNGHNKPNSSKSFSLLSEKFIRLFLPEDKKDIIFDSVKVKRPHCIKSVNNKNLFIDIYVELKCNNEIIQKIIIEDKVNAEEHNNQLEEYRNAIMEIDNSFLENYSFSFVVIGKRSDKYIEKIESKEWYVIQRESILDCLKNYPNDLAISEKGVLEQYIIYLNILEDDLKNYHKKEISKWNSNNCQGLFNDLSKDIVDADWGHVNNQKGGFWAMWFNLYQFYTNRNDSFTIYLQIQFNPELYEDSKIVVKLLSNNYDESENNETYNQIKMYREIVRNLTSMKNFKLSRRSNSKSISIGYNKLFTNGVNQNNININEIRDNINNTILNYDEVKKELLNELNKKIPNFHLLNTRL